MPHSDQADRGNRVVMILGIVAIVLFSANLLSMLSTRVWPRLQHLALFSEDVPSPETPALHVPESFHLKIAPRRHTIIRFGTWPKVAGNSYRHADGLDADLDRLERDILRETKRLNSEIFKAEQTRASAQANLEEAITLQLHLARKDTDAGSAASESNTRIK